MPRNRFSIALYLILVFASGVLVGVVSHRLYVTSTVSATGPLTQPNTADAVRKKYLTDMRTRVGVDDQQVEAVNKILDETKRKFDQLHESEKPTRDRISREQVEAISALLTPTQKKAYEDWRAERARLHAQQQMQQQKKK